MDEKLFIFLIFECFSRNIIKFPSGTRLKVSEMWDLGLIINFHLFSNVVLLGQDLHPLFSSPPGDPELPRHSSSKEAGMVFLKFIIS